MPSYLFHETMNCEVTFVRRITADNKTDAMNMAQDGDGEILGVAIGDAVAGQELQELFPDAPHYIPAGFYLEASRT